MDITIHRKLAKKYIYENYIADKKRKLFLFIKITSIFFTPKTFNFFHNIHLNVYNNILE